MRVQTDTYNVYKFDELSKEAQERVLDTFREQEDFPFLEDDMEYKLEELLKQYKLKYDELPKMYYSLSYCQGDGAMFYGTVYYKQYTVNITHQGHYYHYNSKSFDIDLTNGNNISMATHERISEEFNELYIDLCRELEKYGYAIMDATLSDESIIDMVNANEYEFTEDGAIA